MTSTKVEDDLIAKITKAVDIREKGNPLLAGGLLTEVVNFCYDNCLDLICARALGERIVCSKHLYQKEALQIYLSQMMDDIKKGKTLCVSESDHAVFYLRHGDVCASLGEHAKAEDLYYQAHSLVRKGGAEEVEYLGHFAEALANNSASTDWNLERAMSLFRKAFLILDGIPEEHLDIKHRLIILSGLHGRLATVAFKSRRFVLGVRSLHACWRMSRDLAHKHNYPMRLEQFWLRVRGRGV